MVLIQLVYPLDEWKSSEKSAHSVDGHSLIVGSGKTLKGTHGMEGKKINVAPAQQIVKGNSTPPFPGNTLGKGSIEGIGMGQATVFDCDQGPCLGLATPVGDAAEKQTIPGFKTVQGRTGLSKGSGIKVAEQDIVFKNQDMLCASRQPIFQTKHVGFKNALFLVFRVLCNNHKFNPSQQTYSRKLLFRLLPPIEADIKGDAINLIEKIPSVRQIHGVDCVLC